MLLIFSYSLHRPVFAKQWFPVFQFNKSLSLYGEITIFKNTTLVFYQRVETCFSKRRQSLYL